MPQPCLCRVGLWHLPVVFLASFLLAQLALQDTARKYAREVVRPKAAHYDEVAQFPKDLIAQGFELGLLNMTIPQELGGVGLRLR